MNIYSTDEIILSKKYSKVIDKNLICYSLEDFATKFCL